MSSIGWFKIEVFYFKVGKLSSFFFFFLRISLFGGATILASCVAI